MNDLPKNLFKISTFFIVGLLAFQTFGQDEQPPWHYCEPYSVDAKQLLAAAREREDPEDVNHEKLLSDMRIEFFADGRVKRSRYSIFRVLTRDGIDSISIDEVWSPWFEKKPIVDARVISRRGIVSRLDPSTIAEAATDKIDDLILSTDKRMQAPLPSVTVGSVVEMTTVEEQSRPFCDQGYLTSTGCGDYSGVDRWRLQIVAPDTMKLNFEQLGIMLEPEITKADGQTTWTFTRSDVKALQHFESNLPSNISIIPIIRVSSGISWQAFAKHYSEIVEKQLADSDLKNPIGKLETENTKEKIEHVLEVLQNRVRYTGLEFGISAIVPKVPSDTWKNGYGDCKDKSVLLVDLLRRIGIDAKVALLRAGRSLDISPELPSMNSFDHAIVFIPKENLWIDPTVKFNPVGTLPSADQGRWALVADPETTEMIKTPVHENTSNHRVVEWNYQLKEGDATIVSMKISTSGNIAASYRDHYSGETKKKLKKSWFESCKDSYEASKLLEYDFSDPYDFSQQFELSGKFVGANNTSVDNEEAICTIDPSTVLSRVPSSFFVAEEESGEDDEEDEDDASPKDTKPKTRSSDFLFDTLHQAVVRYKVTAPPGYVISKTPESATAQVRDVIFKAIFKKESDRCCVATFEVDTGAGLLTGDEYEQFKKQLIEITGDKNTNWKYEFVFTNRANDFVRAGRYKEAVDLLSKDLDKTPEDPFLKMRMAYVMLNMGLGKAARIEAQKAVALRPDSAYLQEQLADLLAHDLLGRHLEGEYDFAGAEAAYRKAIELDPKQRTATFNLAVLYEHGPVAIRYQNVKHLAKAIKLYEDCHENDDYRLFENYLLCLAHAREHKKILEKLELMENAPSYEYTRTTSLAVVHGVSKAIAHAGKLYSDQDEGAEFLSYCANLANVTAEYQTAAELFEAVEPVLTARDFSSRVEFIRQLEAAEQQAFDKRDPRHPVRAMLSWSITDGRRVEQLSEFVKLPEHETEIAQFLELQIPAGFGRLRAVGMGRTERVNSFLDLLEFETKSIEQFSLISVSGKNSEVAEAVVGKARFFVEKSSDGTFRVLPLATASDKISSRAIELIDSGQHDEARKLLRFANRELGSRTAILAPMTARPSAVIYQLADKKDSTQLKLCAAALGYSDSALAFAKEQLPKQEKGIQLQLLRFIAGISEYQSEFKNKKREDLSPYFRQIADLNPSPSAREALIAVLIRERKFSEVEKLLTGYTEKRANKNFLSMMKIRLWQAQGKFDKASKSIKELLDDTPGVPNANLYLWNAMFMDQVPSDILDFAKTSVRRYRSDDRLMHTYATLLARNQKFPEAKAGLVLTVRTRRSKNLIPADHYVLGLLAEGAGLTDIARSYYKDALKDESDSPVATSILAKRQLQALSSTKNGRAKNKIDSEEPTATPPSTKATSPSKPKQR